MADRTIEPEFVAKTVARSLPSKTRPRLATEAEERLAPLEHAAAAQYASMETFEHHFNKLAEDIEREHQDALDAEARTKQAYELASLTARAAELAQASLVADLHEEDMNADNDDSAIPEDGDWEDSLVHNVSDLRAQMVKK